MADREKLIKAVEFCRANVNCDGCSYDRECGTRDNAIEDDTLALLREQEPVKPNISDNGLPDEGGTWWYVCGKCGDAIDPDDAYCRHCGRAVKWDE